MPLSSDITLPKGVNPVFPDKCVVCHAKPDSTIRIAQNSQNAVLAFFMPILLLFGWSRVEVPICRSCKPRFRLQRWGRELVCWTLVLILIWWLMPHFKGWSGLTRKLAVGGLVLLGISPYIFAEVFWPRIFDTTARGKEVDYEFASPEYAAEFERLNSPDRQEPTQGPGLCLALLRSGWKCHRFPQSNVVVALPHDFVAAFDGEGVLIGTLDGKSHNFSATLHSQEEFQSDPPLAYSFLAHLAHKSSATPIDKGTYRYFKDPKTTSDEQLEYTFYVVAIPGAVVVVSIASPPGLGRPEPLSRIEAAIPDLIAELA
jgi:hypothetical protein